MSVNQDISKFDSLVDVTTYIFKFSVLFFVSSVSLWFKIDVYSLLFKVHFT